MLSPGIGQQEEFDISEVANMGMAKQQKKARNRQNLERMPGWRFDSLAIRIDSRLRME
jgi:hypothetical protein